MTCSPQVEMERHIHVREASNIYEQEANNGIMKTCSPQVDIHAQDSKCGIVINSALTKIETCSLKWKWDRYLYMYRRRKVE